MFEKEAEEYVIEKHNIDIKKQPVDFSLRCEFAEDFTDFQRGAEFGYNKANEWHEVEKGDLPKSSELSVIGILKDGKFAIGHSFIECYYSKEDGWSDCYGNSLYHEVEYWTEGNFPKESEND